MTGKWRNFLIVISLCLRLGSGAHAEADDPGDFSLSDPVVHGNLAIYFVYGKSRGGPVPLTLREALDKKRITVRETGQVNELQIENPGDGEVFIQSGDIVKGGRQDRVRSVSLLLPPHSGAIPIDSFCVESGRWSARGVEDARTFSSANADLPSRTAKLEMAGALMPKPDGTIAPVGSRQQQIWRSVEEIQGRLSSNLGAPVAAPESQTSLELALKAIISLARTGAQVAAGRGGAWAGGDRQDRTGEGVRPLVAGDRRRGKARMDVLPLVRARRRLVQPRRRGDTTRTAAVRP